MPGLFDGGLRDAVVEFDNNVPGLNFLAFNDVHCDHDTGDRCGKLGAPTRLPGLRRLRLHHAVGLHPGPEIRFRYRPNLNRNFGFRLLPFFRGGATAAAKRDHGHGKTGGQDRTTGIQPCDGHASLLLRLAPHVIYATDLHS